MPKLIDLTGNRYGALTVVDRGEGTGGSTRWNCVCECGKQKLVDSFRLRSGVVLSCGCKNECFRSTKLSVGDTRVCKFGHEYKVTEPMVRNKSYTCPKCASQHSVEWARQNREKKRESNREQHKKRSQSELYVKKGLYGITCVIRHCDVYS